MIDLYFFVTSGESIFLARRTCTMSSFEMSVFQSIGGGRLPAPMNVFILASRGVIVFAFSAVMIRFQSVSERFLSQVRTAQISFPCALKRLGYVNTALFPFGVRNSTDRIVSTASDGVACALRAPESSSSVGEV